MWAEQPTHRSTIWRFSLEDVDSGQRFGFADLDGLICHLLELMEERPNQRQCDRETNPITHSEQQ
jgi:hypothetical protein